MFKERVKKQLKSIQISITPSHDNTSSGKFLQSYWSLITGRGTQLFLPWSNEGLPKVFILVVSFVIF